MGSFSTLESRRSTSWERFPGLTAAHIFAMKLVKGQTLAALLQRTG